LAKKGPPILERRSVHTGKHCSESIDVIYSHYYEMLLSITPFKAD
jgi:hypothetical protein